jgi:hypothetical protein
MSSVAPQVFVCVKSCAADVDSAMPGDPKVSGDVPLFVIVTVCAALLVPTD